MGKEKLEKLDMKTINFTDENIAKIAEIFPNVVSEDENGKVIDFEALKQELSDNIVEGHKERYSLNWPGKREAQLTANTPTTKTLRPCEEESVDFDRTENLYIEGDNLEVLKILQESYLNKIKMIYIDPPYNTGNDFIYNDTFKRDTEEELLESGQKDEDGGRLVANLDSNGRYHSDWLSMMYPRLKLARNLLKEDGVIFISIDDNEVHNLKKICDEVFGEDNFISELVWRKKSSGGQHSSTFLDFHEYILVYSKKNTSSNDFLVERSEKQLESFKFEDEYIKERGKYLLSPLKSWLDERKTLIYPIECPDGTTINTQWVCSEPTYFKLLEEGRIVFKQNSKSNEWSVYKKQYSKENGGKVKPASMILDIAQTQHGKREIKELFEGKDVMSFPKPLNLISYFINMLNLEENDIILDFFSGSGTTAHATMKLNSEDNGNRKFIMVQLPEKTDEKSEAYKAGYKTIPEIGKERIRRAGNKILNDKFSMLNKKNNSKLNIQNSKLDIGFRVLKLDNSNMKDVYFNPTELSQDNLFDTVDNIKDDRSELDLLFSILIDWGVDLTLPITKESIKGKDCYFVDEDSLCACFENDLDEEFIKELASRYLLRVVFRDSGFASDDVKDNVSQIFKQLNENCDIKVI